MEEFKANQELSRAIQENRKQLRETLGKFFFDYGRGKCGCNSNRYEPTRKLVFNYNWVRYYLCISVYRISNYKIKRKGKDMEVLVAPYVLTSLVCIGLLIWFRTKSGKKWLDDL